MAIRVPGTSYEYGARERSTEHRAQNAESTGPRRLRMQPNNLPLLAPLRNSGDGDWRTRYVQRMAVQNAISVVYCVRVGRESLRCIFRVSGCQFCHPLPSRLHTGRAWSSRYQGFRFLFLGEEMNGVQVGYVMAKLAVAFPRTDQRHHGAFQH